MIAAGHRPGSFQPSPETIAAIAAALDCSEDSARANVYQGLRRLRRVPGAGTLRLRTVLAAPIERKKRFAGRG